MFAYRLAERLGRANPYELLDEMPRWLIDEWMAIAVCDGWLAFETEQGMEPGDAEAMIAKRYG